MKERAMKFFLAMFMIFLFRVSFAQEVSSGSDYKQPIVFIHIGVVLPSHLEIAIKQARLFNCDAPLYLVANQCAYESQKDVLELSKVIFVSCESLLPSVQHIAFNKRSRLDQDFREGFWQYATERFFYLEELIREFQLTSVVLGCDKFG